MLQVDQVDLSNKSQVDRFIKFHYTLYKGCPQWVPPFYSDIKVMMSPQKHPFYEFSEAEFFTVSNGGEIVGRVAMLVNKPFNKYHDKKEGIFYLFDTVDDQEVVNALFSRAFEWCKGRGLNHLIGPKGFSLFDGYGIQTEGTQFRQMMTMMNYNFDYYPRLVEAVGFTKEVDFMSCYVPADKFRLSEKVHAIAKRVKEKGTFQIKQFKNKADMLKYAIPLGRAYNNTFINNWEYYPLTDREVKFLVDTLMTVLDYRLVKIIMYNDNIVGFLLGFPDISAAMQRQGGHITPWGVVDYMLEMKRTRWVSFNGMGVLPEYHGRGGNALLYSEMEHAVRSEDFHFDHAELTQVANTAVQMRQDLENLGGKAYKNHRVYQINI
jgi:hypothetical protein